MKKITRRNKRIRVRRRFTRRRRGGTSSTITVVRSTGTSKEFDLEKVFDSGVYLINIPETKCRLAFQKKKDIHYFLLENTKNAFIDGGELTLIHLEDNEDEDDIKWLLETLPQIFIAKDGSFARFLNQHKIQKIQRENSNCIPDDLEDVATKSSVKDELEKQNQQLQEKCPAFSLKLDYLYRLPGTKVTYTEIFPNLVLCLYYNDENCIASIEMLYNKRNHQIEINSLTDAKFEGKKLNKLLRASAILLSPKIYPAAREIYSAAINPTYAWLMIKYFDASIPTGLRKFAKKKHNLEIKKTDDITFSLLQEYMNKGMDLEFSIDLESGVDIARNVFTNTIKKEISC